MCTRPLAPQKHAHYSKRVRPSHGRRWWKRRTCWLLRTRERDAELEDARCKSHSVRILFVTLLSSFRAHQRTGLLVSNTRIAPVTTTLQTGHARRAGASSASAQAVRCTRSDARTAAAAAGHRARRRPGKRSTRASAAAAVVVAQQQQLALQPAQQPVQRAAR
jgi:hypothetical protein